MKYQLIIDEEKEESIVIIAHKKNKLILDIEALLKKETFNLLGYLDESIHPLKLTEVYAFYTRDLKVYAMTNDKEYIIRERIYKIEELVPESFIKINQGCLVNINKILRFESSIGGSIKVVLKNNFSDFISRRELKNVKRRIGI